MKLHYYRLLQVDKQNLMNINRYSRHILLSEIGEEGQKKINDANVLVIGAGGLGCPILQYLTAAGVGTIGIVDFDVVDETNLQRQILFGNASLGVNKAIAAKERLSDLNPDIIINIYPEKLTADNAIDLFKPYDIIVDGTDNFSTRYLINDTAILTNKPLVYGAIYKFEGQVSVFNYKNGPSYRCLFPTPPEEGTIGNCADIGVLGVLPGIIGTMQANEVLKLILGLGNLLSGRLFCFNALTNATMTLKLKRSETEIKRVLDEKENFKTIHSNTLNCEIPIIEIPIEDTLQKQNIQFIDVREPHEQPKLDDLNPIEIPLGTLEMQLSQLNPNLDTIVFCQSGIRSKKAVNILLKHNITNCYSLKGGVIAVLENSK